MSASANYLAVDLGASSGRVLLGRWDGDKISLEELHRFANGPVTAMGNQYWDVLRIWDEIKRGIASYTHQHTSPLAGLGVDTWGVDFVLLDKQGNLIGNPYHYRDPRTDGMMEIAFQKVPRRQIFIQTGNQFMPFNTIYQLLSMAQNHDPRLDIAQTLLMMPDLFHYWLGGQKLTEFTIATTSQMYDIRHGRWATDLLSDLDLPSGLLPSVVSPGTILGQSGRQLMTETGLRQPVSVVAPASHDTSSAIAAIPGLDEHSVYISSGTWSLLGVEISGPILDDQALASNFANEGGINNKINFQKILTGLWLLQESRHQWVRKGSEYSWSELLSLGEQAEPFRSQIDPDAPDFLNPENMLEAIVNFCRQTGQPVPENAGDFSRCCLESLALNYRYTIEELENLTGKHLDTIRIVGGGSRNGLLSQFTANACRRRVICGPVEATALGNLLIQIIATGHLPDISTGRKFVAGSFQQQEYEPDSTDKWDEAYVRFKKLKDREKL